MLVREALATSRFWCLCAYYALCGGMWNALNFHIGAVLEEQRLGQSAEMGADLGAEGDEARPSPSTARAHLYLPLAAASAVSAVVGGAVLDRTPAPRKLLALAAPALCMSLSLAGLGSCAIARRSHLLAVGIALGCYQGLDKTVPPVVAGAAFGRRNNGRIEALFLLVRQCSGALGVQALGAGRDAMGSAAGILHAASVALGVLSMSVLFAGQATAPWPALSSPQPPAGAERAKKRS